MAGLLRIRELGDLTAGATLAVTVAGMVVVFAVSAALFVAFERPS